MESQNSAKLMLDLNPGTSRSLPFDIDLNETPVASPRETPGYSNDVVEMVRAFSAETKKAGCGACGREEEVGAVVRCGGCKRGFHLSCLGSRGRQAIKLEGWLCSECMSNGGSDKRLRVENGGRGLLDINAPPPREVEGEEIGEIDNFRFLGVREQVENGDVNNHKIHTVSDSSFTGNAFDGPVTCSNLLNLRIGSDLHRACDFEDLHHRSLHFGSTVKERFLFKDNTYQKVLPLTPNEIFLQSLREFIFEKQGVLGEGWHVEFLYCPKRLKTFAVYCAPDGNRFESVFDVACHLGLMMNKSDGINSVKKGLNLRRRRKEPSRLSRANNVMKLSQENLRDSYTQVCSSENILEVITENNCLETQRFKDGFPVQFEDFFVLSVGKVDLRPSYHNISQIWPVGYKSSWHDKITGSIFECNVTDGGDSGPVFKVRRFPCSTRPIPIGATVLSGPNFSPYDCQVKPSLSNFAFNGDIDTDIEAILSNDSPPRLDCDSISCSRDRLNETNNSKKLFNIVLVEPIGEFLIEGRSSSLVWTMVSQTLVHALCKAYNQTGLLQICCKHQLDGVMMDAKTRDCLGSLAKFGYAYGPVNVTRIIQNENEFNNLCEVLVRWLDQDRFGLDIEFVQEIIEQLPGVHDLSKYELLSKRICDPMQTVQSGFFMVKMNSDVCFNQKEGGYKRFNKTQVKGDVVMNDRMPPGTPLSSKLPEGLIGDVLQAWELLWRFSEVLGLQEPLSFEQLVEELMNPWFVGNTCIENNVQTEVQEGIDLTLCSSDASNSKLPNRKLVALTKAHSSLLKLLVGELQAKISSFVNPRLDAGESKQKRGRKRDAENNVSSLKKTKLDMLPINELTWPELARRYILTVLSMEANFDFSSDNISRESWKAFYCLKGDGGPLCGSLTGVVGMEADAMLLAEATNRIFGSMNYKKDTSGMDHKEINALKASSKAITKMEGFIPEWAQALEPVRKLPTNVGTRIRKCVYDALAKDPPEWAKTILEHSISKEVYKGNASGPTKKAVLSLLAEVCGENTKQKVDRKQKEKKRGSTIADLIMKKCRIVLRQAAAADEEKMFCNSLGKTLSNFNDNDDEGLLGFPAMVSRPLDFRTIDLRLAMGAYGGSHEAFHEEVGEMWNNIRSVYRGRSDLLHLAETLSQNFEVLYEEEVLPLIHKVSKFADTQPLSAEAKKEMEDIFESASEIPRAPWDDGVCKVCGVDKDDDNVLLCDSCDSEYHTYCLDPPLARIPEGNWYCPSCVTGQCLAQCQSQETHLIGRCRRKRYQGEFTQNFVGALTQLATTMETKEYWEFSVEERVFLLKYLCDEVLNTASIREHLDICASTSVDLQQKLRSLYSEVRNLKLREESLGAKLARAKESKIEGSFSVSHDYLLSSNPIHGAKGQIDYQQSATAIDNSQSSLPFPRTEEECISMQNDIHLSIPQEARNLSDGDIFDGDNSEVMSIKKEIFLLQESTSNLESQLLRVSFRKEYLGKDSDNRLYWGFIRPEESPWVVVDGSMPNKDIKPGSSSSWICLQSDSEINKLIEWLRDSVIRERELKQSILLWKNQPALLNSINREKEVTDVNCYWSKAVIALEKKYGNEIDRCQCLELILPSGQHCLSCHHTFSSSLEFDEHKSRCTSCLASNDEPFVKGKRNQPTNEDSSGEKGKKVSKSKSGKNHVTLQKELGCPFDIKEISSKFITKDSNRELVNEIGLISSNGCPSLLPNTFSSFHNEPALIMMGPTKDIEIINANAPTNLDGLAKTECIEHQFGMEVGSGCRIKDSSLRSIVGKVSVIMLRRLKMNLLDMDAALNEVAIRPSKARLDKRCQWRAFVKSAKSIYEMVQATITLENMIKSEYLSNQWWYWSSHTAAARISTISSLALRIYTLDSLILYENLFLDSGSREIEKLDCLATEKTPPSSDSTSTTKSSNKTSKKRKDSGG